MKYCAKCNIEISSGSYCSPCNKIRCREYYLNNKNSKLNKQSKYDNSHKEERKLYMAQYKESNKAELSLKRKDYNSKNKKRASEYVKHKRKTNPSFKITCALRRRLQKTIKSKNGHKNIKTMDLIGCTSDELKIYLESKFLPTMTWNNYGEYWHIDHIIPCSSFDLIDEEQQKKCFHYTNLQPLFATTTIIDDVTYIGNLNKSNKL